MRKKSAVNSLSPRFKHMIFHIFTCRIVFCSARDCPGYDSLPETSGVLLVTLIGVGGHMGRLAVNTFD